MSVNTATGHIALLRGGASAPADAPAPASSSEHVKLRMRAIIGKSREDESDKTGKLWEVRIIEAGVSLNGLDYPPDVLEESAPLFAGVPIYAAKFGKSPGDEPKNHHLPGEVKAQEPRGLVGNLVGRIKEAWWNEDAKAIDGLMSIIDPPTRDKLRAAHDDGELGEGVDKPVLGLSIDAAGLKEGAKVTKIVRPESVDLVTKAAAGGEILRLVAEADTEDDVKLDELKGAVREVFAAEVAKLREQDHGSDAVADLRKMLAESDGDTKKALATRIVAMLREMGLVSMPQAQEQANQADRFDRMAAGIRGLLEQAPEGGAKGYQQALTALAEDVLGKPEEDATKRRIAALETKLREQAIGRALDRLGPKLDIRDLPAAMSLVDLSGVQVKESDGGALEVEGLEPALVKLLEAKPYLKNEKPAAPAPGGDTKQDPAAGGAQGAQVKEEEEEEETAGPGGSNIGGMVSGDEKTTGDQKPAPRGQSVRLVEGAPDGQSDELRAVEARLAQVIPWARDGNDDAITEMAILARKRSALLA